MRSNQIRSDQIILGERHDIVSENLLQAGIELTRQALKFVPRPHVFTTSSLNMIKKNNVRHIGDNTDLPCKHHTLHNVVLMLGQRRRRLANIKTTLGQCVMFIRLR